MNKITGKITRVERKGHTVYGNPIKVVTVDTYRPELPLLDNVGNPTGLVFPATEHTAKVFRISDNASLAFEIENGEFRDQAHTFALTRAGRISHVIREPRA